MRVHLNVEDFRVTSHRRVSREDAGLPLWPGACRVNVGEVNAPLLPAGRNKVWADEAQETFAVAQPALAKENVRLVYAINWTISGHRAPDYARKRRHEIHDRKHRI